MSTCTGGMNEKRLNLKGALFLSALPYRRALFNGGGFQKLIPPLPDGTSPSLLRYFTDQEIQRAKDTASKALRMYKGQSDFRGYFSFWDPVYPEFLAQIYDPPPVLFYRGAPPIFQNEVHAIVGTRNPEVIARKATDLLVESLSGKVQTLVSGFARGVDREAHLAGIRYGISGIAVLASGVDLPGPVSNLDLLRLADHKGVPFTLLSEFPPGTRASKYAFPRRNRIIAGLARKIYLMQAPVGSGSLITARFGLDGGRDVAVFDHPLLDGAGRNDGGRALLEQGAGRVQLDFSGGRIVQSSDLWSGKIQWELDFSGSGPGAKQRPFPHPGRITWLGGDSFYIDLRNGDGQAGGPGDGI